jgi:hypothetical protein
MIEPVATLKARVEASSYRKQGAELGFPASYLHDVVKGNRPPSDGLIDALGLERTYRRKRANGSN